MCACWGKATRLDRVTVAGWLGREGLAWMLWQLEVGWHIFLYHHLFLQDWWSSFDNGIIWNCREELSWRIWHLSPIALLLSLYARHWRPLSKKIQIRNLLLLIFDGSWVMKHVQYRLINHPFHQLCCTTLCAVSLHVALYVWIVGELIFLGVVINYDIATVSPCVK